MNSLANLLQNASPRWEVTRDVVARHPASAAETTAALLEDLRLLTDLLEADADDPQHVVDIRIAIEHIVLLIGRFVPVVNTAIADLYMTDVSDLEGDSAAPATPATARALCETLNDLRQQWESLEQRDLNDQRERTRTAVDVALLASDLNALSVRALAALLLSRL